MDSSNGNNGILEQQQQQQQAPAKLTPEQEEELKLRSKYPNPQKPGGSSFIQKMLHKGSKKYFDSGDYNMAKSKNKAALSKQVPPSSIQQQNLVEMPSPTATQQAVNNELNSVGSSNNSLDNERQQPTTLNTAAFEQPMLINSSNTNTSTTSTSTSTNTAPIVTITVNSLNNSINNPSSFANITNTAGNHTLSSSISTSSMLSSSISSDKLTNFQLNTNPSSLLDEDEIGHGIPTPECIPQSRKHSIVQSKLATPTLSSS